MNLVCFVCIHIIIFHFLFSCLFSSSLTTLWTSPLFSLTKPLLYPLFLKPLFILSLSFCFSFNPYSVSLTPNSPSVLLPSPLLSSPPLHQVPRLTLNFKFTVLHTMHPLHRNLLPQSNVVETSELSQNTQLEANNVSLHYICIMYVTHTNIYIKLERLELSQVTQLEVDHAGLLYI